MNKKALLVPITVVFAFCTVSAGLTVYSKPGEAPGSSDFTVKVKQAGDWVTVPLYSFYDYIRGKSDAYGYFDFSGTVEVQVTPNFTTLRSYKLLPDESGRSASATASNRTGNTVYFTLSGSPRHLTLVSNGDYRERVCHVFGNPMPTVTGGDITFDAGYHDVGNIDVGHGQTLYIAGGAYVACEQVHLNGDNSKILGRGIVVNKNMNTPVVRIYGNHTKLNGFIIGGTRHRPDDNAEWTIRSDNVDGIDVYNIKLCRAMGYSSDGIDPCGTSNVAIKNCFFHTADDAISPKAWDHDGHITNIKAWDCVFFCVNNNVFATYETGARSFADFGMFDSDVLNITTHDYGDAAGVGNVFAITNDTGADLYNFHFENIRIYNAHRFITIQYPCMWWDGPNFKRDGEIHNLYFTNIVMDQKSPSVIKGYSSSRRVYDIHFENLVMDGDFIESASEGKISIGKSTSNITFVSSNTKDTEPPKITSVIGPTETSVEVRFNEPVTKESAENTDNYAISDGIGITNASLEDDNTTVILAVSTLTLKKTYTLTVSNITDRASTPNSGGDQKQFSYSGELQITGLTVSSGKSYEIVQGISDGDKQYVDRTITFGSLGDLAGMTCIRTANDDKSATGDRFLTFSVNRRNVVYVAHDNRVSAPPAWLSSWDNDGERAGISEAYPDGITVYSRQFDAGTVSLGANGATEYESMYSVFVDAVGDETFVSHAAPHEALHRAPLHIYDTGRTLRLAGLQPNRAYTVALTDARGRVSRVRTTTGSRGTASLSIASRSRGIYLVTVRSAGHRARMTAILP